MAIPPACTEEQFLRAVASHQMTVLRDDGVYRHLLFKRPNTIACYFDILTWPGHLCVAGDMGTYVFKRLHDMFEFFKTGKPAEPGESLRINPCYWAEKVEASCSRGAGVEEYREERFREAISRWLDDINADEELRKAVEDEVLIHADEGEHEAVRAALDFTHDGRQVFQDFWESRLREYTHGYLWICYAIVWGIAKYDESKAGARQAEAGKA